MTNLSLTRRDAAALRAMRDEVLDVYREVYAAQLHDPFRTPERFWDRLVAYASRSRRMAERAVGVPVEGGLTLDSGGCRVGVSGVAPMTGPCADG